MKIFIWMKYFLNLPKLIKDYEKLIWNSQFNFNIHDECRINIFPSMNSSKLNKNENFRQHCECVEYFV